MLVLCCAVLCVVWSRSSFWSWLVAVAEGEVVVEVEAEVEVFSSFLAVFSRGNCYYYYYCWYYYY